MSNPLYDEYAQRFPLAQSAWRDDDHSFDARHYRLKQHVQGCEPYLFDDCMENVYIPAEGMMFIDNSFVESFGKIWNFHIVGDPEALEKTDPRIRKLNYEYMGYATGTTLFDFEYQGLVDYKSVSDWDAIMVWNSAYVTKFGDKFVAIHGGVGLKGVKIGVSFSDNLLDWTPHPDNPILVPPDWADYYSNTKNEHVLHWNGKYIIYYCVSTKSGYQALTWAETEDFQTYRLSEKPSFLDTKHLRGTSGIESPCVVERDGIFHLFYCNGQGTWHVISDNPYYWNPVKGKYLWGPFVAQEVFQWKGEWWLSSTKKEELRRQDRSIGISHHGDIEDERRNLAGMFLAHICWEGDFPALEKPSDFLRKHPEFLNTAGIKLSQDES